MTTITTNRQAHYDYEVLDQKEVGIKLVGTEIKSIRDTGMSLENAYAVIDNDEVWLANCHIQPYRFGNVHNHEPMRRRKLLLHKQEIEKWKNAMHPGMTLIPLDAHYTDGNVKIELALAKGKKKYDKRESIKEKDAEREIRG